MMGNTPKKPADRHPQQDPTDANDRDSESRRPAADPIMQQLKQYYDDVASEPLPDELIELLMKLDDAESRR